MYQIKIRVSYEPYFIYIDNVIMANATEEGLCVFFKDGESISWKFFSNFDYYVLTMKEGDSQC